MKILKFVAENFKKLSAVEITPDGNMVVISGKNGAGKSSVLDGVEASLRGGRCLPKEPIKRGEIRGKVETLLGETTPLYKVTRKFFGGTTNLVVEKIDGDIKSKVNSPQAFLESVVGEISFDPLAFLNKQPAEQRNTLMEFLGLNLQEFADKIESIKAQRSDVRKEKERKLHEAESITTTPNLPPQEVSSESLLAELKTIQIYNEKYQKIEVANASHKTQLVRLNEDIVAAQKALLDWQNRLDTLVAQRNDIVALLQKQPNLQKVDTAEVEAKLKSLSATNEAIRRNAQKKEAMAAMEKCVEEYSKLGDDIKIVENQKAKKLAEMVMPVEGLTILPDGLGYNGLPLEQECQSKRLKICVAIAMAMNPKLKVLRVDGNGLDEDSRATISELVAGKDYQLWMEVVSANNAIGFYIEDGNLVGTPNEKETS